MQYRPACILFALLFAIVADCATSSADIYRWDNGQRIPGTEGISPGPGVDLINRNLEYADFSQIDSPEFPAFNLTGARFHSSNLSNASFNFANLTRANFTAANLTSTNLGFAVLKDADMTGAIVTDAEFGSTTHQGFTKEQLYSTASYQAKDLSGIRLGTSFVHFYPGPSNDLTGWNFSEQNLANASFAGARLVDADLKDAIVTGADFGGATFRGFTKEQLYSTASYRGKDLHGMILSYNNLMGWNLNGQKLTGVNLYEANLIDVDFTGAVVTGAIFSNTTSTGLGKEQLYSTASYKSKDLREVNFEFYNLSGWDFSGQDLTGSSLALATLANVDFTGANVAGVDFAFTISRGFTKEQFYSTASYKAKDLHGIRFSGIHSITPSDRLGSNLSGWDLSGQNLSGAIFDFARMTNANLSGANLPNVTFESARLGNSDLTGADTRGAQGLILAGAVSRNMILPDGGIRGLDLKAGESLIVRDDDALVAAPPRGSVSPRPPIPVTIYNRLNMDENSVLQLLIEADPWDSLISFQRGVPARLGGTLDIKFAVDVDSASQIGRTLRIFDWTGVTPSGQFEVRSPYVWDVSHLYTTGEITLIAVPEPSAALLLMIGISGFANWLAGIGTMKFSRVVG